MIKSAPIRPVTGTRTKNEYARIRLRLPFGAIFWIFGGSPGYGNLMSYTLVTPYNQGKTGGHVTTNPGTIQSLIPGIVQSEPRSGTENPFFD